MLRLRSKIPRKSVSSSCNPTCSTCNRSTSTTTSSNKMRPRPLQASFYSCIYNNTSQRKSFLGHHFKVSTASISSRLLASSSASLSASSSSQAYQSNNNDNNDIDQVINKVNISYPTSSSSSNVNKKTNTFDRRKREILDYMQNALAYELEQILDLVDGNDDDYENNHGLISHGKNRSKKNLRNRMQKRIYAEKKQRRKRNKTKQQLQQQLILHEETTITTHTNSNNLQEDEDIILNIPTAKESSSSSSGSSPSTTTTTTTTSSSELSSSLLIPSLVEDDENSTRREKETTLTSLLHNDSENDITSITNTTTAASTNNYNNDSNSSSRNLVDLLDDDDYGFDDDDDDDNNDGNTYNDKNTVHTEDTIHGNNSMITQRENHLLRLLQDETPQDKRSGSLLDLLDDCDISAAANYQTSKIHNQQKQEDMDRNNNDMSISFSSLPEKEQKTSTNLSSSSSLLDLLNDDDNHNYMNQNSTTNLNSMLMNERTNSVDSSSTRNSSSPLLDLLNIDSYNDSTSKAEISTNIHGSSSSLKSDSLSSPSNQQSSMLDLLDGKSNVNSMSESSTNQTVLSNNIIGSSPPSSSSSSSLMELLDFDSTDFGSATSNEKTSNPDDQVQSSSIYDHDNINLDDLLMKLKSLLSVIRRKDWNRYQHYQAQSDGDVETHSRYFNTVSDRNKDCTDIVETLVINDNDGDLTVEEERNNSIPAKKDTLLEKVQNKSREENELIALLINEILVGIQQNRWQLQTNEFNLLLLYVATSSLKEKGDILLNVYLNMKEFGLSGFDNSAPNGDTFAILMTAFDKLEQSTAVAAELGAQMIEYGQNKTNGFELDEQVMNLAMRIFAKRLDRDRARSLIEFAKAEELEIQPFTYLPMLELYKKDNDQKEALKLIEACIEESRVSRSFGLNSFLSSAINWPRKNREGKSIFTSSYFESLIDLLESVDHLQINFNLWKKLVSTTANVAKFESFESWELVHRCCRALLDHREMNGRQIDPSIVKVGLKVAELTNDTKLAANLICRVDVSNKPNMMITLQQKEEEEISSTFRQSSISIPPSVYTRIIKFCISTGDMNSADEFLRHAVSTNIPMKALNNFYSLVLNGHAKRGNLERTEQIMMEMEELRIPKCESSYAALIHAYTMNNMQDKAAEMLESMINGACGDHIEPGISTFTASILAALSNNDWEKILEINDLMIAKGIKPSGTTLQAVLLANFRKAENDRAVKVIEEAIESKTPMDKATFLLFVKYMLPDLYVNGDIVSMRKELRLLASSPSSDFADEAMELNKRLRDCLMEDQRQPSKAKNSAMIQKKRDQLWRLAVREAIDLSKFTITT